MNLIKLEDKSSIYTLTELQNLEFAVKSTVFNEDLIEAGLVTIEDIFEVKDADDYACLFHNETPICYLPKDIKNLNAVLLERNISNCIRHAYVEKLL